MLKVRQSEASRLVNTAIFKCLNVSAHGRFKVYIKDLSPGSLTAGKAETIRIDSVAYKEGEPEFIGVYESASEDSNTVRINVFIGSLDKIYNKIPGNLYRRV